MGFIQDQIFAATDASLARPDNDQVAGIIQHLEDHPEESFNATDALRQRFEVVNSKVRLLALFILDKAMK